MKCILFYVVCLCTMASCVTDPQDYPYNGTAEDIRRISSLDGSQDLSLDPKPDLIEDMQEDSRQRPRGELQCMGKNCICDEGTLCACPPGETCDKIKCEGQGCGIECTDAKECKLECKKEQMCDLTCGDQDDKDCKLDKCEEERQCSNGVRVCNRPCPEDQ